MSSNEIIQYYDDLIRLAVSKCKSQADAEDLVSDTMLAAFVYMHKGGEIEHLKTWLVNTLYHKYNDNLRKKYRSPVMVCFDEGLDIPEEDNDDYPASEEAAKVRKELNHLAYITREVLIRFYYGGQSVADIAKGLDIPEGTVKSRLSAGRSQMKKGLEAMETGENYLPGELYLSFGGSAGLKGEPTSLVEGDLIAKNLLILAYEKPLTISELSKAISIPAAYIEPIVKKLVDGELMVQTEGNKLYSDFIITRPQDALKKFKPQLDFAHKHFDTVWSILRGMSDRISELTCVQSMSIAEKTILERYAILKALQDFQHFGTGKIEAPRFPKRKDGGRWFAQAVAFDAGYHMKEYQEAQEYAIQGGHRTSEATSVGRAKRIRLYEFDTTLWDSPHRFGGAYELYFKYIIPMLWHIYDDIPLEASDIPNEFISYMPTLEVVGLIGYSKGKPYVKIPVMEKASYQELCALVQTATEEIKAAIGGEFATLITSMKTWIPKHLTSVPELYRYHDAAKYFAMAIVREAYGKGLHLKDVDSCCPPVVLVYEE